MKHKILRLIEIYKAIVRWDMVFITGIVLNIICILEVLGIGVEVSMKLSTWLLLNFLGILIVILVGVKIIVNLPVSLQKIMWDKDKNIVEYIKSYYEK